MKKKLEQTLLLSLILGAIGFLLNLAVVLKGYDDAGLPKHSFFPATVLPLFVLLAALMPLVIFFKLKGARKYLHMFTASMPAAAGIGAVALAIFVSSLADLIQGSQGVALWRNIFGILGGLALVPCALCRRKGTRPVWLCWGAVTMYLVLLLIANYPLWSREAELNRYLYQLLAGALLMLTSYQQAAADAGIGNLKEYLVLSLMCVVLCPVAMVGSSQWFIYLTFLGYHILNLMSLDLSRHKQHEGE